MAGKSAVLTVKILTDASQSGKGTQQALSSYEKFQSGVDKLVPAAAVTAAAIAAIGVKAVDSASRTEQAMGALDSVFGENAATVKGWAADAADSLGLAQSEYGELASVIGAQLSNMGLSAQDAMTGTKDLITLGADLSATFGGSTTDAVNALSSALRGEADPAEKYGLSLKQADINARLAEKGLSGLEGEALKAAKTQAILELATEQAGGAVGQFGREADTVAGQQQRANAQFENAASAIGTHLMPIVAEVASKFADLAKWVSQNSTLVTIIIGVVGGLAVGILALSAAMKAVAVVQAAWAAGTKAMTAIQAAWAAVTKGVTAGQWLLNAAMTANPIGLIIAAVVALVAAFVLLWNNCEGFRSFFIGMWKAIQTAIGAVATWFSAVWTAIVNWFRSVWTAVSNWFKLQWTAIKLAVQIVVNWFRSAWQAIANWFKGIWSTMRLAVQLVVNWFRSAWANIATFFRNLVMAWQVVFQAVFAGIRAVVERVASFFRSIWQNAVNAVKAVITTLRSVFTSVFNAILAPIRAVQRAFDAVVGAIRNVISWLGRIKIPDILGSIGGMFGAGASASAAGYYAAAAPAGASLRSPRLGAAATRAASGRGGIVINVSGGLDSADSIARRIEDVLRRRERRAGGVFLPRRAG